MCHALVKLCLVGNKTLIYSELEQTEAAMTLHVRCTK